MSPLPRRILIRLVRPIHPTWDTNQSSLFYSLITQLPPSHIIWKKIPSLDILYPHFPVSLGLTNLRGQSCLEMAGGESESLPSLVPGNRICGCHMVSSQKTGPEGVGRLGVRATLPHCAGCPPAPEMQCSHTAMWP